MTETVTTLGTPLAVPQKGRAGGFLALAGAAVLLAGGGVGAYFVLGHTTNAAAAVATAVQESLNRKTADLSMHISASAAGTTATITGTGSMDFATNAVNLTMNINAGGQSITERAVYDGATIFVNLGSLVGLAAPGKSWVSIDTGQPTSGAGGVGGTGGTVGNPTAMLKLLGAQGNQVVALGSSMVNGVSVQGYTVHLTPASITKDLSEAHLPSWMKQAVSTVQSPDVTEDVYIDGSNQLLSVVATVHARANNQNVVENTSMDFSNYGTSVAIVDPPPNDVVSFSQFQQDAAAKNAASST